MFQVPRRTFLAASISLLMASISFAQQAGRKVRVTIVSIAPPGTVVQERASWAFHFAANGFKEGQNLSLTLIHTSVDSQKDMERKAAQVIATSPDVICVQTTRVSQLFQRLTRDIPIVFSEVGDPIRAGLVQDLSRPGGNLTGSTNRVFELAGKRLELLKELKPDIRRVALVMSQGEPTNQFMREALTTASRRLGVQIIDLTLPDLATDAALIEALREAKVQAFALGIIRLGGDDNSELFALLRKARLLTVFSDESAVERGALVSLGEADTDVFERTVRLATRILRGEKPAAIPVDQASKIRLTINLKTARAMEITIPDSVRLRADRVIE